MKFLNSKAAMIGVGVLVGGVVLYFIGKKLLGGAGKTAKDVANAVNPLNHDNVFSRAVNAVGDALDNSNDDNSFSLGSWVYDWFNPTYDPNANLRDPDERTVNQLNNEVIE